MQDLNQNQKKLKVNNTCGKDKKSTKVEHFDGEDVIDKI